MRDQRGSANQFFSYRLSVIADRTPELLAERHDLFVVAGSDDARTQFPDLIFGRHKALRRGALVFSALASIRPIQDFPRSHPVKPVGLPE